MKITHITRDMYDILVMKNINKEKQCNNNRLMYLKYV